MDKVAYKNIKVLLHHLKVNKDYLIEEANLNEILGAEINKELNELIDDYEQLIDFISNHAE